MLRTLLRCVLLALVASLGARHAQAQAPTFLLQWGTSGTGDGQFQSPFGIAVDPTGCVYVCDQYNNRIQKFSPDGAFITKWGTYGLDPGQFNIPHSIGVDAMGHVAVVDVADRIQVFTSDGVLMHSWVQPDHASPTIRDVTVDAMGVIYIADYQAERIEKYSLAGDFLGSVGDGIDIPPGSVALDPMGNIYVGRYGKIRQIVKFSSDGGQLTSFGQEGDGDGQFQSPVGLAASDDLAYVVDYQNYRVLFFTSTGEFLGKWGSPGAGPGEFEQPVRTALASDGAVYVVDLLNNRIQKFAHVVTPVLRRSWGALKAQYR